MGGPWIMPIPFVQGENLAPTAAGVQFSTPRSNLLGQSSPTIMEQWELAAIYVPSAFYINNAAGTVVNASIQLLYGGDIVWQQANRQEYPAGAILRNVLFAEEFINPIHVKRGRTLALRLLWSSLAGLEATSAAISAHIEPPSLNYMIENGTLTYNAERLSGHREL